MLYIFGKSEVRALPPGKHSAVNECFKISTFRGGTQQILGGLTNFLLRQFSNLTNSLPFQYLSGYGGSTVKSDFLGRGY